MVPALRHRLEQAKRTAGVVKDRPSRCHEFVFLFSKSKRYSYDYEAVKEPALNGTR